MISTSFTFRPDRKIAQEFVRVLQKMAVYARKLKRYPKGKQSKAIHETRVLIKRLRALLWFAKQTIPPTKLTQAKLHLQRASHLLAPQRDLIVMQSVLKKISRKMSVPERQKILIRISSTSDFRQAADEKFGPSLCQAIALLLETINQIEQEAKTCSEWPSPSHRLARAFNAAKKAGKKALQEGKAVSFHTWRKKTKRLLYQLQLIQAAPGYRMARTIKRVDKLQGILGDYHDSVVVQDRMRQSPPPKMPRSLVKDSVKLLKKRKHRLQKKKPGKRPSGSN